MIGLYPFKMTEISKRNMQPRSKCSHVKNMLSIYINLLPRQFLLVYSVLFIAFAISVSGQPLQQPHQHFQCGPVDVNVTCERWGFDTCISDNGEFYCLPCSHEYLTTLCGTQEEQEGCHLYCTQKALDKETGKIKANIVEKLADLQTKLDLSKKDKILRLKRITKLTESTSKKSLALYAVAGVLILVLLFGVICVIIWCIRNMRTKARCEEDNLNSSASIPLTRDELSNSVSENSEVTELHDVNVPPDSVNDMNVFENEQDTNRPDTEQGDNGNADECSALTKLCNVPVTNSEGNNKLAIKEYDVSQP